MDSLDYLGVIFWLFFISVSVVIIFISESNKKVKNKLLELGTDPQYVYIYRRKAIMAAFRKFSIVNDGKVIGTLGNGKFLKIEKSLLVNNEFGIKMKSASVIKRTYSFEELNKPIYFKCEVDKFIGGGKLIQLFLSK